MSKFTIDTEGLKAKIKAGISEANLKGQKINIEIPTKGPSFSYSETPPPTPKIPPELQGADAALNTFGNHEIQAIFFWQGLGGLLSQILLPLMDEIRQQIYSVFPTVKLSPADLADAVNRGFKDPALAAAIATLSGISHDDFHTLTDLAGEAPGPTQLAEALRRGLIVEDSGDPAKPGFNQGIREGRLKNMWIPMMKGLAEIYPTPVDALDALLKGQITTEEGKKLYTELGGAPQFFEILYHTQGEGPSPLEAAEMARRGIIQKEGEGPASTSFHQAVRESHYRNKWTDVYWGLSEYFPTPSEVSTLLVAGAITHDEAVKFLTERGMSPDVMQAYLVDASHRKTTNVLDLALSTVQTLYYDRLIDASTATEMIEALGYNAQEADFTLAIQDMKRVQNAMSKAITRISGLYTSYKIDRTATLNALNGMNIPADQVGPLMDLWDAERAASVKVLTQAEIVDAWYYKLVDQSTAQIMLEQLGYPPLEAWILLSNKNKGALPGVPAASAITPATGVK